MKKQMLLVLSLLLLPVFANAQVFGHWLPTDSWDPSNHPAWQYGAAHYDDPWAQDLRAWQEKINAAMRKEIDRFLGLDWAQGLKRLCQAYRKVSSEADLRRKERKNPPFSIQNIPVPASATLGGFIYDKTEKALEGFTEIHVMIYSWPLKKHFKVELPDIPKEEVRNYAQDRAYIETSKLLKDLRSEPFDIHPAVTDELSREALEYQLCVIEKGLNSCEKDFRMEYGDRKLQEFKNILEVREKWVYYMEKNPVFKYYVLTHDVSALQSLSKQEYETLLAFFSGKELANGWQYRTLTRPVKTQINADGYLIRSSFDDGLGGVGVNVNPIYVKISDQLVAEISPEILSINIYRADLRNLRNWKKL